MVWKGFSRAHFILCSTNWCKISPAMCYSHWGVPNKGRITVWLFMLNKMSQLHPLFGFQGEKYTQMSNRRKRGVTYYRWFPLRSGAGPLHGRRQRTQTPDSVSRGSGHPEPHLCCLPGLSSLQPLLRTETSTWSGTGARYRGREPMTPGNWCRWHLWWSGL